MSVFKELRSISAKVPLPWSIRNVEHIIIHSFLHRQRYGMMASLRLSIILNRLLDIVLSLQRSCKMETSIHILTLRSLLQRSCHIPLHDHQSHDASWVLSLLVRSQSWVYFRLGLKVGTPPFIDLGVCLGLHELHELFKLAVLCEHSGDFYSMGVGFDEVGDCLVVHLLLLVMLGKLIVDVLDVDHVLFLGKFDGFVPVSLGTEHFCEKVVSFAFLVVVSSIVH